MSQEEGIAFCERLFAARLDGHPLLSNATHLRGSAIWIKFRASSAATGCTRSTWRESGAVVLMGDAAHTAHYSIGSGTKLALEDAIELARCCASTVQKAWTGAARLPGRPLGRGAEDPERGAQFDGVVRECRPLHALRGRAIRLFDADEEPAHPPREPAVARRGLCRGLRKLGVRPRLRAGRPAPPRPRARAADADTVSCARRRAEEPYRRIADGAVLGAGRRSGRLSSGAPRRARDGRRRHGVRRNDVRVAGCADHARLPGPWNDAQRDAWRRIVDFVHAETDAKIAMQLGHAGAKGSTCVPWDGGGEQPLADGQLAARRPPARNSISPAFRKRRAPRRATTSRGSRPISSPRPGAPPRRASTGSSCTARTAICCPRSSRRLPTAATTNMAATSPAAAAIRSKCLRRSAPRGPRTSRSACGFRRTTGPKAASSPTMRSRSAGCSRPRART